MNPHQILILFAISLAIFFSRCGRDNEAEKAECTTPDSIINPNGTSELSMLMRQMHDRADEMKQLIAQGKMPGTFPEEFARLNTATPTDSLTKKPSFEGFSKNYISALQSVYQSDESAVTAKYNEMVNACLACHSDHCPGPVPKIKKLIIN